MHVSKFSSPFPDHFEHFGYFVRRFISILTLRYFVSCIPPKTCEYVKVLSKIISQSNFGPTSARNRRRGGCRTQFCRLNLRLTPNLPTQVEYDGKIDDNVLTKKPTKYDKRVRGSSQRVTSQPQKEFVTSYFEGASFHYYKMQVTNELCKQYNFLIFSVVCTATLH